MSGIGNIRPNLHFFQYIQAYKPFANPVPPNTKQYKLILTKYQPVSSFLVILGQALPVHLVPCWWVGLWLCTLIPTY